MTMDRLAGKILEAVDDALAVRQERDVAGRNRYSRPRKGKRKQCEHTDRVDRIQSLLASKTNDVRC